MLTVNEIFHSIQGESRRAGDPCVFVRLTACDLRCSWCDTPYAFHEGKKRSLDDVLDAVEAYGCPLVEITGGEPLLQEDVYPLMERLIARGTQENRPELWQRAIELYRGDFLEDLPYAEWAASERDRLRGLYVGTAEKLARHAFEQGDDDGAMGMAHAIIARDRC